jgi:O-antigen biosynthesis protein WbqV
VIPALEPIDWHVFLKRPRLPQPTPQMIDSIRQERVLVTGAGGSIGSALALRLAAIGAKRLVLLESSESALFALQSALAQAAPTKPPQCVLGSVFDADLLAEAFANYTPSIVFHAAAFKHVPLLEEQPLAAIENNIFGTRTLASAAATYGARFVLLSTDKAVEPASIMGATKRVAECIVLAESGTVLRLGNVLASSNSAAESFARQLAAGGPLTVTDPAARRYFLTIEEAVDLLIAAAAEPNRPVLLAPELKAPQFITDLARFMARVLAPDREIPIEFTEPRPGDKELEKLWSSSETVVPAAAPPLLSIDSPLKSGAGLDRELDTLERALRARDLPAAIASLRSLVPDFTPSAALLALAQQSPLRAAR